MRRTASALDRARSVPMFANRVAGAIHLTHCAAVELGEQGIRINTISPGPIATGIFGKAVGLGSDEADQRIDLAEAAIAVVAPRWQSLPRVGSAEDVASAALFLACDASRFITGHNLVVGLAGLG